MNLYDILGLRKDATEAEIKKAAKKKQQRSHPDRAGGDEATFKLVGKALAVLSDPERRKRYDETGSEDAHKAHKETDEEAAVRILGGIFIHCLTTDQSFNGDILAAVTAEILKGTHEGPKHIKALKSALCKAKRALSKNLKQSGGRPNYLQNTLTGFIAAQQTKIEQSEQAVRIAPIMLEILKDYKWESDAPQFSYPNMFIYDSSILDSKGS